jgi:ribosome biogenesis GTPase
MPEGLIVKALSGFYYVKPNNAVEPVVQCRARGQFKLKNVTPLVGDRVQYEMTDRGEGTVMEVFPRTRSLVRPPVANVDQVMLVFSARQPEPSLILLDKFLVHAAQADLPVVLVFTKCDLLASADDEPRVAWQQMLDVYRQIGYPVYETGRSDEASLEPIRAQFAGKISVLAGQSGVGKSSLLNRLQPGLSLQTGEISMKLGRGKHTTRHVELLPFGVDGYVADTPGFSSLDFFDLAADDLSAHYLEFARFADQCKFRGCMHLSEPSCAVVRAVADGLVAAHRYESYVQFVQEIKAQKRRY